MLISLASWIFSVKQYYAVVGLENNYVYVRLAEMLLSKQADIGQDANAS